MSQLRLLVAGVVLGVCAQAQAPLEKLMGSAFPWEITASRSGARVAWISSQRGPWNVWWAEGPRFAAKAVTHYREDDGVEISSLKFTGDGKAVVYVRGGASRGDSPNPSSNPNGAEQGVWWAPLGPGAPKRLGTGSAPQASPAGPRVVWLRGGTVWTAIPGSEQKPAPLFHAKGSATGLAFSPDGRKLAFTSLRGDHAFVGVFDIAGRTLRWMDASTDRDSEVTWSPDGRQVAFVRTPAAQRGEPYGARRAAAPWSLRVADVATGEGREVFRASEGAGSVFQPVAVGPSLVWMESGELVFPWEKTGWKLLYAVRGGEARVLTPGEFEVEHVAVGPGGREVWIASNQGDIERRHLWRVRMDGAPERMTEGTGLEWMPAVLGDGRGVAHLASDWRRPARAQVRLADGSMVELSGEAEEFPKELVEPKAVEFAATDGARVRGQLFVPRGLKEGEKRPAVIFLHGGSRRQMLLGWHPMYYYHNAYAFNQALASRGYVVLSVNYRSGTGYGMEFREALEYGPTGASEYRDVEGAGRWLKSRPEVDGTRIALWGGSYGGYLTALGLARNSELFAAGVDLHGVHDWARDLADTRSESRMSEGFRKTAFASSPMASMDGWRSPVLLVHGDDDRNVQFNQTVLLVEELRKRKVEHEVIVFPDEVHDFLLHRNWMRALGAAERYVGEKLGR